MSGVSSISAGDDARSGEYAGIISRGIAFVLDALLLVCCWCIGLLVAQALIRLFDVSDGQFDRAVEVAAAGTAGLASVFAYNITCLALFGKTVGMMALGLRVVRINGQRPGAGIAAIRTAAYAVSAILLLGFIWIAYDDRRQGWHDKIARTFVVYDWTESNGRAHQTPLDDRLVPGGLAMDGQD